jgi:hypothetical protein
MNGESIHIQPTSDTSHGLSTQPGVALVPDNKSTQRLTSRILVDAGIIGLASLAVAIFVGLVDNYHSVRANLLTVKTSCGDRLVELAGEISKRARIVEISPEESEQTAEHVASDISSTGAWNRVLYTCMIPELIDVNDDLQVTFVEARKRSDDAFHQAPDAGFSDLADANHWALFALDQVRNADLTGWWIVSVGADAPSVKYKMGDRFER